MLWLRDEEPANHERVAHVLLPKDYIRYRLSGELATDASDASGTLFLDLRSRGWSSEVLRALDVPAAWLPPVFESTEPTGSVTDAAADRSGSRRACRSPRAAETTPPRRSVPRSRTKG